MADKRYSPADTAEHASVIEQAWPEIGADVTLGGVIRDEFLAQQAKLQVATGDIISLQVRLTDARNQYKLERHELWELVKRVRGGTKAQYGDDSSEYEMVGGARLGERK